MFKGLFRSSEAKKVVENMINIKKIVAFVSLFTPRERALKYVYRTMITWSSGVLPGSWSIVLVAKTDM